MNRREFLISAISAGVPIAFFTVRGVTEPPTRRPDDDLGSPTELAPSPSPVAQDLQRQIAALPTAGGVIRVPAGSIRLDAPLLIDRDNVTLEGVGQGATTLHWTGEGAAIRNADSAVARRQFTLRELTIRNDEAPTSAGGILLDNFYNALIDRCRFEAIGSQGVGIEFAAIGSTYYNTVRSSWVNCSASGSVGIRWTDGERPPNANRVVDTTISGNGDVSNVDIAAGDTALLLGCAIEGGRLLSLSSSFCQVIGCRFESGPVTVTGSNNTFVGNSYADSVEFSDRGRDNRRAAE